MTGYRPEALVASIRGFTVITRACVRVHLVYGSPHLQRRTGDRFARSFREPSRAACMSVEDCTVRSLDRKRIVI